MELGVEVAGSIVRECCHDRLLAAGADHAAGLRVLQPGLDHVLLDPGQRPFHRPAVRGRHAPVAADERGKGDGLGCGQRDVAAGAVMDPAVLALAAELPSVAVRHLALEDRLEYLRIDRPGKAQSLGPLAGPGAGIPVRGIVSGVVPLPLVIGDALGGRGDGADRGDHIKSGFRPPGRVRLSKARPPAHPAFAGRTHRVPRDYKRLSRPLDWRAVPALPLPPRLSRPLRPGSTHPASPDRLRRRSGFRRPAAGRPCHPARFWHQLPAHRHPVCFPPAERAAPRPPPALRRAA